MYVGILLELNMLELMQWLDSCFSPTEILYSDFLDMKS